MSFILTPENHQSSNVKISDTLTDDLNFAFMGAGIWWLVSRLISNSLFT